MIDQLNEIAKGLPEELIIFFLSMLPVWELRGSIPLAMHGFNMSAFQAFLWSFLGNFTAGVILVYLLDPAVKYFVSKIPFLKNLYDRLYKKTKHKHGKKIELYAELGIFFLVALPLPGTGAWTGALASQVFRLKKLPSILSIGFGLIACGIIVLFASGALNLLI
jgi:uncharacterized membrane protein